MGGIQLSRLDPDKLFVEFRDNVTKTAPIEGRKYTLTHSDITAELFLTVGLNYAYDKISPIRDEVLAQWRYFNDMNILYGYVYVDGHLGANNPNIAEKRNSIFVRELPFALEAIIYGDRYLFSANPILNSSPIYIYFASVYPHLNRIEYFGTPTDYSVEHS